MNRAKIFQHRSLQASFLLVGYAGVDSAGRLVRHRKVAGLLVPADEICGLAVNIDPLCLSLRVCLDFQKDSLSHFWLDSPRWNIAHDGPESDLQQR